MRIGIGVKLFFSVLVASVVMAVAMGFATRISFQRGFLGYLNELDSKRMTVLTTLLAAHWRASGDSQQAWDSLRGRDDMWRHMVRYAGYRVHIQDRPLRKLPPMFGAYGDSLSCIQPRRPVVPGEASALLDTDLDLPWPSERELRAREKRPPVGGIHVVRRHGMHGARPHETPPPPPQFAPESSEASLFDVLLDPVEAEVRRLAGMPPADMRDPQAGMPMGAGGPSQEDMPPPAHLGPDPDSRPDAAARMTLQDVDGTFIVGNPNPGPSANYVPILVDGVVAGWVATTPNVELTDAADLAFQERQESSAWYIGALAVLLAGLIAWAMSRVTLVPARRLAAATHALADGKYDIRVKPHSSDELGDLAKTFNRLARTLQQNENMRRAFMADVSHELRTPLAIMRGELEAVEDGLQPLDERVLQSMQSEVAILSKLVDDIHMLSLTEVAPVAYQWQTFDIVALVDSVMPAWQERLASKGLTLKRRGLVDRIDILGDSNRLLQVLHNLLENTVRYVDAGSLVQVECQRGGLGVIITIDDSGAGMSAEEYERLFDRFYRREASRNRATGGSGLGLAICRGIIEAHGGTIVAQTAPIGGLRIRIELPLASSSGGNV